MEIAMIIIAVVAIAAALFFYLKSAKATLSTEAIKEMVESKLKDFAQDEVKNLIVDIVKTSIQSGISADNVSEIIEEKLKDFAQDDVKQLILEMVNEVISEKQLVSQGTVAEMIEQPENFGITKKA